MEILQPPGWKKPRGYANGTVSAGRIVFVAGQIGWNENQEFDSHDLVTQTRQTLLNTVAVLKEAGADPAHITRMTWYITDKQAYLDSAAELGEVYREVIGRHYPAMAMVQVSALMEDEALVEIETTAVIP